MSGPKLNLSAEFFTTGQVAKMCGVASRTAAGWIDTGKLRGYRVPGGQDRRVSRKNLLAFLLEHKMEDALAKLDAAKTVLLAGVATHLEERLRGLLGERCRVTVAPTLFALGMALRDPPRAAVVDLTVGSDRYDVRAAVAKLAEVCKVVVVLLAEDDPEPVRVAYQGGVFEGVHLVGHPVDAEMVARLILGGE